MRIENAVKFKSLPAVIVFTFLFSLVSLGNEANEEVDSLYALGLSMGLGEMKTSMPIIYKAYLLSDRKGYVMGRAKAGMVLGGMYREKGEHKKSLDYALKAHHDFLLVGDTLNATKLTNNIASLYYYLGNYSKALELTQTASDEFMRLGDSSLYMFANTSKAMCYLKLGEIKKSKQLYFQTYSYFLRKADESNVANVLGDLAMIYEKENHLDSVYSCLDKCLQIHTVVKNPMGITTTCLDMGAHLIATGRENEALPYLDTAYHYSRMLERKELILSTAKYLSNVYVSLGDYKNAHYYSQIELAYQDSIAKQEKTNALDFQLLDQEMQNLQLENSLRKKDQKLQSTLLEKQRMAYLSFFGIILILIGIVVQLSRTRKKMKRLNNDLTDQKDELLEKRNELFEMNKLKDRVFSTISHDLRAPISSVKGILTFIKKGYVEVEELPDLLDKAEKQVKNTLDTMDNLLNWAKNQMKGTEYNPVEFSLIDEVIATVETFVSEANRKKLRLTYHVPENELFVFADREMIKSALRNLLSNALKFTHQGGEVSVTVDEFEDQLRVAVKDSGVGISEERQKRLFVQTDGVSTSGTDNEKGTGLGLSLSYEFIKRNGGDIIIESKEGVGSIFKLYLPKVKTKKKKYTMAGVFSVLY